MKTFLLLLFCIFSITLVAQNVGIGTAYPNNGKLVIRQNTNTSGLVVGDSTTGISFGEFQSPFIGFNNYNLNGRKLMGNGHAAYFYFNPGVGNLFYNNTEVSGTMGSAPTLTNRFTISRLGDVGLGTSAPAYKLDIRGGTIRLRDDTENMAIRIEDNAGRRSIIMKPNSYSNAGEIILFEDGGDSTISIRGSDGSGQSGEIVFRKPGVAGTTMELDGDYGGTSRSRIIVDEIQIKGGADFAEYFDISETDVQPEAGMVVCIDPAAAGKMNVSTVAYDKKVAGVISGANGINAGMTMGQRGTVADGKFPIAITGRVYVKAEALQHAIEPGDMLTTSSMTGHAMKASKTKKAAGAIIGKAMGHLAAGQTGYILVLLSIQ